MKIENLATVKGRLLLKDIFHSLRYEKQRSAIAVFLICWRICISGKNIDRYLNVESKVVYPLGFRRGTVLWMEEILNRYYFSAINSFVYFGAAILLVLIALQRFSDILDNRFVIAGVCFEALLLMFMFIVMLFSPNEDLLDEADNSTTGEDLISEVGEIGTEFAAAVMQMENLTHALTEIGSQQKEMIYEVMKMANNNALAVSPNPEMLHIMSETNKTLLEFKETIERLNESTNKLQQKQVEDVVREELSRILVNNVNKVNE
ncbi:MAG: hypothetical protein WCR42_13745 [bacterium]